MFLAIVLLLFHFQKTKKKLIKYLEKVYANDMNNLSNVLAEITIWYYQVFKL